MINSNRDKLQRLEIGEALWNCFKHTEYSVIETKMIAFFARSENSERVVLATVWRRRA